MMQNKSHKYNHIKVICLLFVIIGHVLKMYSSQGAIFIKDVPFIDQIINLIYIFHMPVFFIVTGSIYGICIENGKYQDNYRFLINKIRRVLIPYYLIGFTLLPLVLKMCNIENSGYFDILLKNILLAYDPKHLWFLLTLFLVFVSTIFLKKANNSQILGISMILLICHIFSPKIFQISNFLYYQFYFYMGFICNREYENIKAKKNYSMIFSFFLILLLIVIVRLIDNANHHLYLLCAMVVPIIVFLILLNTKLDFLFCKYDIKKYFMEIYLFHPLIIYVYTAISYDIPLILNIIVCFVISIAVSILIAKIPINKRKELGDLL